MAATSKVLGTVTSVVGEVRATASDGTTRILQVGDKVFSDEVITTSPSGDVKIALEGAAGKTLECGNDTTLALTEGLLGLGTAVTAQPTTPAKPPVAGTDVAALQAAIASGADPSQVADATAAGGAPGAGGADGGGSHQPVVIEQGNTAGVVTSGFNTEGASIQFPTPEFELNPIDEEPSVSVTVQVQVQVQVEVDLGVEGQPNVVKGPAEGGVFAVSAAGDAVSLVEGTMEGTLEIPFVITLSQVFDSDVQVTYQIVPASADYSTDFFNGQLINTVTISAGENSFIVPIQIVRDHFVEGNESFSIVLIDAVNATIDPAHSSASVTIFNDDALPVANDDINWAKEDTDLIIQGNVVDGENHSPDDTHGADPSGSIDFADVADVDDEVLTVTSVNGDSANVGVEITGSHGTLTLNADGTYTYSVLNNASAAIQGLSEGDTLTDTFTYTVTDGFNGDSNVATLEITIFGADDGVTITGLIPEVEGGEVTVDEDDLVDGSDTSKESLSQSDSFFISAPDGVDDLTIGGNAIITDGVFAATSFATGFGNTLSITGYNAATGEITYTYTLNDNETHADANGQNSLFENFAVVLTDEDGSTANDTLSVRIIDDVPDAVNDGVINVAEDAPLIINAFGNDEFGADGVDTDNNPNVVVTFTQGSLGVVSYNVGTGQFTYTPNAGAAGADSFTYTIEDGDGDTSTATVSLLIAADSTPQVGTAENLTVDEDGFAFAADDTTTVRNDETNSTESLTDSGQVVVDFGNDVPANLLASIELLDTGGLDGQLVTLAGDSVTFALVGGALVGSANGAEVIRIEITNALAGPGAGEVTYSYSVTLSQPVEHADGNLENSDLLSGVTFRVTDSDTDQQTGTFNVTVVDDVPAFTIINDGNDAGTVVNISAPNPGSNTTFNAQFADWQYGADSSGGTPTLTGVSGNVSLSGASTAGSLVIELKDSGGAVVGTLTLNGDGTDSLAVIHRAAELVTDVLLTGDVTASGPSLTKTINSTLGLTVTVTASDNDGVPNQDGDDEVNPSTQGWAVADNQVDLNESIGFSFSEAVQRFSFVADGFTGNPSNGDVGVTIRVFYDAGKTIFQDFNVNMTSGSSVEVANLSDFGLGGVYSTIWGVNVLSNNTNDSNDGFRLNNVTVSQVSETPPADLDYTFTVNVVDNDGDPVAQTFSVHLDGSNTGGLVVEAIAGTSGADTLNGTGGNDILIGGDSSDTFVFTSVEDGGDTVTDFTVADVNDGGDVLDINSVLPGSVPQATQASDLAGYVVLEALDSSTLAVKVDANGAVGGENYQTLVTLQLTNVDATQVTLQQLLENNQIIT